MTINELQEILQKNGIAGAGGAGFPTYGKLNSKVGTILLNCAECEPLLKVHQQVLQTHAREILNMLNVIADTVDANEVLIGVKGAYKDAVEAVEAELPQFPKIRISFLREVYPAGDEVILIYEATGKIVAPGQLPIDLGIAVFNVETIYNAWQAFKNKLPVIHKYITVTGDVRNPITLKAPIGISVNELIAKAGGTELKDAVYIMGGPMTGKIVNGYDIVTKTTNAIIVLPKDHYIIHKKTSKISIDLKRAMASCCQCEMCTDLCPRHLLGHPIAPHAFMRSATSGITRDLAPFMDTFYCSSCGLCEMYSCMQDLSPRALITKCKTGLQANGIRPEPYTKKPEADKRRAYRLVPMERLMSRIDLHKYNKPAPLMELVILTDEVKIMLSQHIGVPAAPCVKVNDKITKGQIIGGMVKDKLSLPVHASIDGVVTDITDSYIRIQGNKKEGVH